MVKIKLLFKVTFIIGIILFLLELISFYIFKNVYIQYMKDFLQIGLPFVFAIKLLIINFIVALIIVIIFDSIYEALPFGFLRKSINFAFILWGLQTIPFLLHFYISTKFVNNLFLIIFLQYMIIETILAFVITGIYDEFYLKQIKITEKVTSGKEGEKRDENISKSIN